MRIFESAWQAFVNDLVLIIIIPVREIRFCCSVAVGIQMTGYLFTLYTYVDFVTLYQGNMFFVSPALSLPCANI